METIRYRGEQIEIVETRYPAGHRMPAHVHERAGLTLLLSGSIVETAGARTGEARPLGYLFKREGVRHEDHVGLAGAHEIQVWFDPSWLDGGLDGTGLDWWSAGSSTPLIGATLGLFRQVRGQDLDPGDVPVLAADLVAALAPVLRAGSGQPRVLRLVAEAIQDDPSAGRLTARLARQHGIHPVFLARQFRRYFGETVTQRLQRLRSQKAAERIGRHGASLAMVAAECGFCDQSHLNRVFRRVTGITPGEYSRLLRG